MEERMTDAWVEESKRGGHLTRVMLAGLDRSNGDLGRGECHKHIDRAYIPMSILENPQ